jgi:flagellin
MSLNSVNTNYGAMIALESLNQTNSSLQATQKQVSTGYRVADATDDGAAYAVAQSVRSTTGALTTANQQLGNVQGLLSTTQSGLNNISNTMASMRDVLVSLSDANISGNERTQYVAQYNSLLANVKTFIQDANYSGKTLIGNITPQNGASFAVWLQCGMNLVPLMELRRSAVRRFTARSPSPVRNWVVLPLCRGSSVRAANTSGR